jgi:hypothetical protein
MRKFGLSGLVAISLAAVSSSATAAPDFQITYTGTVSGTDGTGVFGAPGDLSGNYTLVYYVTLANGQTSNGGTDASIFGGTWDGLSDPITAVLTIGAQSYTFAGPYDGEADFWANGIGGFDGVEDYASGGNASTYVDDGITGFTAFVSPSFWNSPFSYSAQTGDSATMPFSIAENNESASGNLTAQTVSLGPVAAVPEPATWAMMLLGFGAIGLAVRRRRRTGELSRMTALTI